MLRFSRHGPNFAENRTDMKTNLNDCFQALLLLRETDRSPADFPAACRRLHVPPGWLDEWIFETLGVSGEELWMRL